LPARSPVRSWPDVCRRGCRPRSSSSGLECGHRLHQPDLVGVGERTAAGLAEILLASPREPALAEELVVAARALLTGVQPPSLVVLGGTRALLLPVPEQGSWWVDLVRDHVAAGYVEDLEAFVGG
jgi:hypothetical protein